MLSKFSRVWFPQFTDLNFKSMDDTGKVCFIGLYMNFGESGSVPNQFDVDFTSPTIDLFDEGKLGYDGNIAPNSYLVCVFCDWTPVELSPHGPYYSATDCNVLVQLVPNVVYKQRVAVGLNNCEVIRHNPRYTQDVLTFDWFPVGIYYPNYYNLDSTIGKGFSLASDYDGLYVDALAYLPVSPVFKANWYGNPIADHSLLPNGGAIIDLELHDEFVDPLYSLYFDVFKQTKVQNVNDGVKKISHSYGAGEGRTVLRFWGQNAYDIFYETQGADFIFLADPEPNDLGLWSYVQGFEAVHSVTLDNKKVEVVESTNISS